MTQLTFGFRRWEIPSSTCSWVEDGVPVFVTIGAHCVDLDWQWFKSWQPWNPRTYASLGQ